ncbi:MAG TPA: sialidase family protein, partial [Candidatus Thermoplasmatota archaeon]|nr:sialidase family protein [Candidatus Thermoplasmatota archaeon]
PADPIEPASTSSAGATVRLLGDGTPLPVGEVRGTLEYVLTGHEGGEPSVGVTSSGAVFTVAYDETIRSVDGGRSWETVYDFELEGAPVDPYFTADPMLWVDPVTDIVYTNHMWPPLVCTSIASSADDGATWSEHDGACGTPDVDFQKLGSGKPGPGVNPLAGKAHPSVLYLCYNKILAFTFGLAPVFAGGTSCATSYDGGLTWPVERLIAGRAFSPAGSLGLDCGGGAGVPIGAPDGTVVIAMPGGPAGMCLGRSRDSGLTWEVVAGPTDVLGTSAAPEVGFAADGTMFLAWQDPDYVTWLARSADLGDSWEGPWRVSPPDLTLTYFSALGVTPDGRVALGFVGTPNEADSPDEAPDETRWHLFVATSDDAGAETPSFLVRQATPPDDPVQIGPICLGGAGCDGSRNLLDFIDGAIAPDGTFYVAYTEGCLEDCSSADDSDESEIAVAALRDW